MCTAFILWQQVLVGDQVLRYRRSSVKYGARNNHWSFMHPCSTTPMIEQEIGFVLVISSLAMKSADCGVVWNLMHLLRLDLCQHALLRSTMAGSGPSPLVTNPALQTCTLMYLRTYIQYTYLPLLGWNPSQHAPLCTKYSQQNGLRKGPEVNRVSLTALLTPYLLPHAECCDL